MTRTGERAGGVRAGDTAAFGARVSRLPVAGIFCLAVLGLSIRDWPK